MSKLTRYFDQSASVTADATVAVACGVVAFVAIGLVKGVFLGLGDAVQAAGAGVTGAAVYLRARTNLLDPAPAGFKQPQPPS